MEPAKWMMDVDAVALDNAPDQGLVAHVAFDEGGALRDRPGQAGGKVVEYNHRLAGIQQLERHVAADVSGSAGHENAHRVILFGASVAVARAGPLAFSSTADA